MHINQVIKLIVLCNIFIITNCFAEYVVFRKVDNKILPIDNEELYAKAIYPLLSKYTWPTSIPYADEIAKEFSGPINPINEEVFLRSQLKKISPELDIIFIPTIAYELFAISMILAHQITTVAQGVGEYNFLGPEEISLDYGCFELDEQLAGLIRNSSTIKNVFNFFKKVNLTSPLIKAHTKLNNAIVSRVSSLNVINPQSIKDATYQVIKEMLEKGYPRGLELPLYFNKLITKIQSSEYPDFLSRIFDLEYRASNNFAGLLYHGAKAPNLIDDIFFLYEQDPNFQKYKKILSGSFKEQSLKDLPRFEEPIPVSLSYGNSLFAGWVCGKGACAFSYFNETRLGYAVLIDKRNYLTAIAREINGRKESNQALDFSSIFRIVPLNTLLALTASGTIFHPRTIAYSTQHFIKQQSAVKPMIEVDGLNAPYGFIDNVGFLLRFGDPIKYGHIFSSIIANPQITTVLKLNGATFEEQYNLSGAAQQKRIKQLYENQNENSKFIKALYNLESTVRKISKASKEKKS